MKLVRPTLALKAGRLALFFSKSCAVGAADCPVYLSMNNDPPTLRNDTVQYVPYSREHVNGQKERNPEPKSTTTETIAEQDGYVVSFVKASNCADNRLIVKNTGSGKSTVIAGLNGCTFDPKTNTVIIFTQNEYVGVYNGSTNASQEIASADLP